MISRNIKQVPTVPEWLELSFDTRAKLSNAFGIGKSGIREMADNKVISDGTTPHDLKALNLGSMIAFLEHDCPFYEENLYHLLFTNVIKKLNGEPTEFQKEPEASAPRECTGEHTCQCGERWSRLSGEGAVEEVRGPEPRRAGRPKKEKKAV